MLRLLSLAFVLSSCGPDETISGYAGSVYLLTTLDDVAVTSRATITFPDEGRVTGDGPCNGYNATQSAPYPWFALGPIASTRMACPALSDEAAFFNALEQMQFAEVAGDVLILSNDAGREMVFQAQ